MSSNLSELVDIFRTTGSQESFNKILKHGYAIATHLINRRYSNFGYFDDLLTEANDAIIRSLYSFDDKKGKFSTYCYKSINSAIVAYVKKFSKANVHISSGQVDMCDPCFMMQAKETLSTLGASHAKMITEGHGSRFAKYRLRKKIEPQLISVRPIY